MAELPPASGVPVNVTGLAYYSLESYKVASWCPTPDGTGPAEQVHLVLNVKWMDAPFILRLKSRRATDELIAALQRHRDDVWGEK